jgi:hypothetical protein
MIPRERYGTSGARDRSGGIACELMHKVLNLRAESTGSRAVTLKEAAKKKFTNSSPMIGARPGFTSTSPRFADK